VLILAPGAVRSAEVRTDQRIDRLSTTALLTRPPAALVDAVRQRRARAIDDYREAVFVAWSLAPVVVFLFLWRSGNAARLRDTLRRRFRARWAYRSAFGAALGALATLAAMPFAFAGYRLAFSVGLTEQRIPAWFLDEIVRLGVTAAITAFIVAVVLELVDRTRLWYLIFAAILYVLALGIVAVEPVLFSPLAAAQRPAPAAIVAQGDAVAHKLGVAPVPLEITATSTRSSELGGRTSGLGPFARILLGETAVTKMTSGEREFLLARQYAHVREHDVLLLALAGTTLFIIAAALAVLVSDRIGFRRDDDPLARLALVATCLGISTLLLYPAFNAVERGLERRADAVAIAATQQPAEAVRLFVRRADDDLTALCGRRTTRWYFESRPALGSRIAALRGTQDPCPR
jgi:STE24 endopeptidase